MEVNKFLGTNGFIRRGRFKFLTGSLLLFSIYVIIKYSNLAISDKNFTSQKTENVQRGMIFDKNEKQLAVSTNFWDVGVTPKVIIEKGTKTFAKLISPILDIDEEEIISKIENSKSSKFVSIKKKLDQGTYEELKRLVKLSPFYTGVRFDKKPGRIYPENEVASQLIGYMGDDGTGLTGIEKSMDKELSPNSTFLADSSEAFVNNLQGNNVYLTIDLNLQFNLEEIAREAFLQTNAEGLMLIAADAKNGEILSYISLPSPNLNFYPSSSDEEKRNRPAQNTYEPGSVFKIFSTAAFLDTNSITPDDIFLCDGKYTGVTPYIGCLHDHGWVDAKGALAGSCNDALAQMSEKIESEDFLKKLRELGFNAKTGVEVSGEAVGVLRDPNNRLWSGRSKPSIAIGQEISVTALQMVQAATAIANNGVPLKLTFINKITDSKGNELYSHKPVEKERVLKPSTAQYILNSMEKVTKEGTGHRADLGDVTIGTKTGTAQIADRNHGGYRKDANNSNCLAIFPVEDPKFILYVLLETVPTIKDEDAFAGVIVTPIINKAANIIIDQLGMTRKNASSLVHSGEIFISKPKNYSIENTVPNFIGASKREILPLLDMDDIKIRVIGEGYVTRQKPEPGTPITGDTEIELNLE